MTSDVGSAAEEAAKLFAAMEDWTRRKAGHLLDAEHVATGTPECQFCPVCQGIGALRHVRPEAVEHLLDATASFVAALKSALAGPSPSAPDGHRPPGVQHIDISEA